MASSIWVLARLTLKRILRGKTIWISGLLLLVPLALAGMTLARVEDPSERWSIVCELTFRSLVLLAPVLHLAPAVNEENEGRTYTYLWSRPVARPALLFGKMLAVVPVVAMMTLVALLVAWLIVGLGPGELEPVWLGRALGGAAAGIVGAASFALGAGALFPRYPLVVCLGYIFFAEQILPSVPAIQNISTLYHVHTIAALPRPLEVIAVTGDAWTSVIALAVLSVVWLGLGVWRIRRLEFGTADG